MNIIHTLCHQFPVSTFNCIKPHTFILISHTFNYFVHIIYIYYLIHYHHSSAFPIGWLINGIVYLTGLFLLTPLTHLKLDWINFNTIKILHMISEHSCREPEVVVKCCVKDFKKTYFIVKWFQDAGIEASACARILRLRLHLDIHERDTNNIWCTLTVGPLIMQGFCYSFSNKFSHQYRLWPWTRPQP